MQEHSGCIQWNTLYIQGDMMALFKYEAPKNNDSNAMVEKNASLTAETENAEWMY